VFMGLDINQVTEFVKSKVHPSYTWENYDTTAWKASPHQGGVKYRPADQISRIITCLATP